MQKKIESIEGEIKNLHYNPKEMKHGFSDAGTKELFSGFWDVHVKPVIEYSRQMAEKYEADADAVWLAAVLHDIARLTDEEPHDEIGSERAYKLLLEKGFEKDLAEKVRGIILTHRCRNYPPETLEQKIVATADAMAHFLPPFYFWTSKYSNLPFFDQMEKFSKKIDKDFNSKIFFEEEKEMVKKHFEILKGWFGYNQ